MKNRYLIALLIVGIVITIIGTLFRIMHWPWAERFLILGASLKAIPLLLLAFRLLNNKNFTDQIDN